MIYFWYTQKSLKLYKEWKLQLHLPFPPTSSTSIDKIVSLFLFKNSINNQYCLPGHHWRQFWPRPHPGSHFGPSWCEASRCWSGECQPWTRSRSCSWPARGGLLSAVCCQMSCSPGLMPCLGCRLSRATYALSEATYAFIDASCCLRPRWHVPRAMHHTTSGLFPARYA